MSSEGELFRTRRKELGLSQRAVAEAAHVGLRTVQNFEAGTASPQRANRQAMWAVLGDDNAPRGGQDAPAAAATATPAETVERTWPPDVSVFLDVMGAYLVRFPEQERLRVIHDVTRQIFTQRHESP